MHLALTWPMGGSAEGGMNGLEDLRLGQASDPGIPAPPASVQCRAEHLAWDLVVVQAGGGWAPCQGGLFLQAPVPKPQLESPAYPSLSQGDG